MVKIKNEERDTTKFYFVYFILIFSCFFSQVEAAQNLTSDRARRTPIDYQEFYTINEDDYEQVSTMSRRARVSSMELPTEISPGTWAQPIKVIVINLLKWALHNEPLNQAREKYARKIHFGHWINDPNDDTCMNTRALVLVRDSDQDVDFKPTRKCVVAAGKWHDPYTDQFYSDSKEIQIDHMVPLKNAYISGASDWDFGMRCLYANYMHFKPHLISVNAHENMSKGDRGPESYLPPNENYRCEYVRNWLAIKTIWKLKMNKDEVQAIEDTVIRYNCPTNSFKMSQQGLAEQREFIEQNLGFCLSNRK